MLFFKWISDSWDYEHAQAVQEYGPDEEPEVEADYHRFNMSRGHWRDVATKTDNLGSRMATALGRIEQANTDSLAGIFGDAAWGNKERLPESSLVALTNAVNGLALNSTACCSEMATLRRLRHLQHQPRPGRHLPLLRRACYSDRPPPHHLNRPTINITTSGPLHRNADRPGPGEGAPIGQGWLLAGVLQFNIMATHRRSPAPP